MAQGAGGTLVVLATRYVAVRDHFSCFRRSSCGRRDGQHQSVHRRGFSSRRRYVLVPKSQIVCRKAQRCWVHAAVAGSHVCLGLLGIKTCFAHGFGVTAENWGENGSELRENGTVCCGVSAWVLSVCCFTCLSVFSAYFCGFDVIRNRQNIRRRVADRS